MYYEFGLGDVEAVYTEPLAATVTQTYSDTGFKKTDYGLDFDLRFRIPLAAGIGLILDGRYQLALAERSNDTASSFKNRAITALGGVNFGF